jgi:hypothetical protein
LGYPGQAALRHDLRMATIVTPPPLQASVDKYVRAMQTPHKLLTLHPRKVGHPGNHAALSPAIVLASISAFEGFVEDFVAIMMAHDGAGFGEIAAAVGKWNNPTPRDFANTMKSAFPKAHSAIDAGDQIRTFVFPRVGKSKVVERYLPWNDALEQSRSWMQVRHLLTHGITTGWRTERWPGSLKPSDPPASAVLRAMGPDRHSLGIYGAINCARIYTSSGRIIGGAVAVAYGHTTEWTGLPDFS